MAEEKTINMYFNVKADQLSLKIVVFNLINSIFQTNQNSLDVLVQNGNENEAAEMLKQTNDFKEEIHLLYSN